MTLKKTVASKHNPSTWLHPAQGRSGVPPVAFGVPPKLSIRMVLETARDLGSCGFPGLFLAIALSLLLALGTSNAAQIPAAKIPDSVCVNLGNRKKADITDAELQLMSNAGIKYLRFGINWDILEKTVGVYDFTPYDTFITRMNTYGMKPLLCLAFNNPLYETGQIGVVTAAGRQAFANYSAACATHYASNPNVIFEIWNEADSVPFWGQEGRWDQYMDLVDAAVPPMRAANPNVTIMAGAVTQLTTWQNSIDFLNGCFSRGLLTKVDGLCFHNYGGGTNERVERLHDEILVLRSMMAAYGAPSTFPLFATEFGMEYTAFPGTITQQHQTHAERLVRYYMFAAEGKFALTTWYEWRQTDTGNLYAMVEGTGTGTPRTSYYAMQAMTAQLNGFEYEKRVPTTVSTDYVFVFRNGTQRKLVAWTSDEGTSKTLPVAVNVSSGSFAVATMLNVSAGNVSVSGGQISVTATTAPRYINLGTADVVIPPAKVNLALAGTISAYSSQQSNTPASNMIDGIDYNDADRWTVASSGYPHWIEVDLGSNRDITGTEVATYANRAYRFRVETKADGGSYQTVLDRTANTQPGPIADTFTTVSARYVKLTVTGAYNYTGNFVSMREFKVFGTASVGGTPINFNTQTITGYSAQDAGTHTILDGGATLRANGNAWKKIALPYTVTSNTILEFDFMTTQQGEIQGIGFDSDNNPDTDSTRIFQLHGTQTFGNQTFRTYAGSTWVHYTIPVGQYYTGAMSYLGFVNDHDVTGSTSNGSYRNVTVYEGGGPLTLLLEAETLAKSTSDSVTPFNEAPASGGAADKLNANAINDYVSYTVPVSQTGTYTVYVRFKDHGTRGQFQMAVDGVNRGPVTDQYGPGNWVEVNLGSVPITSTGNHTFRFTVPGKNASSTGYTLTFDYIKLVK